MLNDSIVTVADQEGYFVVDVKILPATLTARYIGYDPASVQVTEHKQILNLELKASNYMLGEVIVSAYEGKQRIIESPGSIALLPQRSFLEPGYGYLCTFGNVQYEQNHYSRDWLTFLIYYIQDQGLLRQHTPDNR
jgi:hypothetical protein